MLRSRVRRWEDETGGLIIIIINLYCSLLLRSVLQTFRRFLLAQEKNKWCFFLMNVTDKDCDEELVHHRWPIVRFFVTLDKVNGNIFSIYFILKWRSCYFLSAQEVRIWEFYNRSLKRLKEHKRLFSNRGTPEEHLRNTWVTLKTSFNFYNWKFQPTWMQIVDRLIVFWWTPG